MPVDEKKPRRGTAGIEFIEKDAYRHRLCQRNDPTLWTKMVGVDFGSGKLSGRDSVALNMYDAC